MGRELKLFRDRLLFRSQFICGGVPKIVNCHIVILACHGKLVLVMRIEFDIQNPVVCVRLNGTRISC